MPIHNVQSKKGCLKTYIIPHNIVLFSVDVSYRLQQRRRVLKKRVRTQGGWQCPFSGYPTKKLHHSVRGGFTKVLAVSVSILTMSVGDATAIEARVRRAVRLSFILMPGGLIGDRGMM